MAHVGSLASAPVRGEDGASPLFSVIVPTRRRPALLPVALRSVLSQDFTDFEVIVVDDDPAGGAEATVAALTDGRVRYLRNDRTPGAAGARNTGAAAARAPYLAFLDDDDAFAPGNLAHHHAALQHVAQDTVLLFGGWQRYDFDADRPIKTICDRHGGWLFEEQMQCNYVSNIGTVVVPKRVFDEVGGFDESFVALEDVDLYLRLAARGPFAYLPEVLAYRREAATGRTSRDPRLELRGFLRLYRRHAQAFRARPLAHHLQASRTFLAAVGARAPGAAVRSLPWVLVGIALDPHNVRRLAREMLRPWRKGTAHAWRPKRIDPAA